MPDDRGGAWKRLSADSRLRVGVFRSVMGDVGNYRNQFHTASQRAAACSPRVAALDTAWCERPSAAASSQNSGDTILISARCPAGKHRGL